MKDRPNIVFVVSDQLRNDMLPLGGHPAAITPNLVQLAETGTYFSGMIDDVRIMEQAVKP